MPIGQQTAQKVIGFLCSPSHADISLLNANPNHAILILTLTLTPTLVLTLILEWYNSCRATLSTYPKSQKRDFAADRHAESDLIIHFILPFLSWQLQLHFFVFSLTNSEDDNAEFLVCRCCLASHCSTSFTICNNSE